MKRLTLIALFCVFSVTAFAQFPLGANKENITAYFAGNVQYASFQQFRTKDGNEALNYTKTRVLGDYTFYFNGQGACSSYTETYDKNTLDDIIWRMDRKFCRLSATEWSDEDNSFHVTLNLRPKKGANYVSITYRPVEQPAVNASTLAAN
jgi:hypothetical protein